MPPRISISSPKATAARAGRWTKPHPSSTTTLEGPTLSSPHPGPPVGRGGIFPALDVVGSGGFFNAPATILPLPTGEGRGEGGRRRPYRCEISGLVPRMLRFFRPGITTDAPDRNSTAARRGRIQHQMTSLAGADCKP